MNTKICAKCKENKQFIEFPRNLKIKDDHHSWCKLCVKSYNKSRYKPVLKLIENDPAPDGHKKCSDCKTIKLATLEFFRKHKKGRYGLFCACRICHLIRDKASRERNKDKIKQRYREKYVKKPIDGRTTRNLIDGKEPAYKICKGPCGLQKVVSEFRIKCKRKLGVNSYHYRCKECDKKYISIRNKEKRELLKVERLKNTPQPKLGYRFCSTCKEEKEATREFFSPNKSNKSGLHPRCKNCVNKFQRERTAKKPKKIKPIPKEGHKFCSKCKLELPLDNFRFCRKYRYCICKVCELKYNLENPIRRFTMRMRKDLFEFLFRGYNEGGKYLGCTREELRKHIEDQFLSGMDWSNYGIVWHIDHYYPLSKALKHNMEAFKKACHYTNLRPLWKKDNLKKGAKIPKEYENINDFLNSKSPSPFKRISWDD
jgi:hypothetical protein